ncbi:caspase family protein [Paenibacillus aceti]|uniref:Peptidase C14 caspase domain-containing protein n=1 Tax=Paenibacillus aceti TaxID=1820010 RepID=A0ABQ1VSC1_9BACL|nr:caspase family protein [Paenibacillus aceti]GGF94122.1 hypothetical protein GCM10010913_14550 [Paenibacillus aceti]
MNQDGDLMIEEIREKTYAVIVAVENYQFGIPKVEYAKNDASEFRNWLINDLKVPNENIKLWSDSNVTRSALTEELQYDISRLSENDKFIFYYAGHGFFDGGSNKITTWDTHQNNLRETTVSLNCILMESLRKSKCDKSLIFIDACASKIGEQLSSRELLIGMNTNEFINFVHSGKYRGMFLSCSREEKSYSSSVLEHGIWTYFLLKALRGEAPEAIIKERFVTNTSL